MATELGVTPRIPARGCMARPLLLGSVMTTFRITLSLLAPLAACGDLGERATDGDCPRGEVCSDDTPRGLHFNGAELGDVFLDLDAPHPTLAGGTQDLRLSYDPGTGISRSLDRPYVADDEGGAGFAVERTRGPVVTLRGVADRTHYLRITDPDGALYDRKELQGAKLASIQIVSSSPEVVEPGDAVVYAPGTQRLTVALFGKVQGGSTTRVVDESMTIALAGATRTAWDSVRISGLPVGRHAMTVRAGDRPEATFDVEVVAGADSIVAHEPLTPLEATTGSVICFSARAAERHVLGLTWTFQADNGTAQAWLVNNCAFIVPEREGTLTLTARAGGQVLAAPFTVAPPTPMIAAPALPATVSDPAPSLLRTPAGERAAAF
jgi:hypothetical protein